VNRWKKKSEGFKNSQRGQNRKMTIVSITNIVMNWINRVIKASPRLRRQQMFGKSTVRKSQGYAESIINTLSEALIALGEDLGGVSISLSFTSAASRQSNQRR
jgi:hypothetical protein